MTFKTADGREWSLALDITTVRRVKERTGFDIANLDGKELAKTEDALMLYDVCEAICQPEDVAAFGRAFSSGEVVEAASDALKESIVNFTRPRRREPIKTLIEKGMEMEAAVQRYAMEKLNDPKLTAKVITEMERLTYGSKSTE